MPVSLPQLPYALDALEPSISKNTLEFHYLKHHQGYVNKLNGMIENSEFANMSLEDIILKSEGGIFNNAAQIWNHTFYFFQFTPDGSSKIGDALAKQINSTFGSMDEMIEKFTAQAMSLFGSGWTWLVVNEQGKLEIINTANANTPLTSKQTPLLVCDVWEHAYYLDRQNLRNAYIENFWKIIDWEVITERFIS